MQTSHRKLKMLPYLQIINVLFYRVDHLEDFQIKNTNS